MATSIEQIKKGYPLPAYNFRVRIENEAYGFSQVTGLSIQYDTMTYKHGLSWREGTDESIGNQHPVTLTLQRGVVAKASNLLQWINSLHRGILGPLKKDVAIDLCDENGEPVVTWIAAAAFPIKLDVPGFDANNNEVAIESIQLKVGNLRVSYH